MGDLLAGEGPQRVRERCRIAVEWPDVILRRRALEPARAARQADERGHGPLDGGWVASDITAGVVDEATQAGHARRLVPCVVVPGVPGIGVGHGHAEHPRPDRADHQRRPGRARAAREQLAVARLVPLPVEVDGTVAQERPDDRERLLELVDAVVEREAERAELRLVPAGTQPEDEPSAADLVDRGSLLGQQGRVVEVRAGDEWPELDPVRGCRDRRQQRPGLQRPACRPVRPAVEQVLADPDRIEAEELDGADHVEQLRPADLAFDFGELDADLQGPAGGR